MTFGSPGPRPRFGGGNPAPQGGSFGQPGPAGSFPAPAQPGGTAGPTGSAGSAAPSGGTRTSFGGGFGAGAPEPMPGTQPTPAATAPTKGPWAWLIGAGVAAILGLMLVILAPLVASATSTLFFTLGLCGWALAGIVSFVLLGIYTLKNTQRQAETFYIEDTTQTLLYRIIMGASFIVVIGAAVEIALFVGKAVGI